MGVGFGLEKIGQFAIRAPWVAALLIAFVCAINIIGVQRINVDDSLTELFRANTEDFKRFEVMAQRFPSSEYDVLAVIEGPFLQDPKALEAMREMAVELNFVDGINGIISLFSAREPPNDQGYPPPVVPDVLPTGDEFKALTDRILKNEIISGKLLSNDGQLALIVMALDRKAVEKLGLRNVIGQIQSALDSQVGNSGLKVSLSGAPVMQLEIRNAVQNDRIIYNGLGFILGAIICLIFFRRFSLMFITIAAPASAILWSLGMLGFLEFRLNLFLNIITPLIMVIAFSDAMHMVFAIRRRMIEGDDRFKATAYAIAQVGPACVLTSLTTALALFSLYLAESALIKTFAIVGGLAAIMAFLAVIIVVPTLSVLLLRGEKDFANSLKKSDKAMSYLRKASDVIGEHVVRMPFLYSFLAMLSVVIFTYAHVSLEPRYRLQDQVPDREQAMKASDRLDKKLTGASPVHVMIEWDKTKKSLYDEDVLAVIGAVHNEVEQTAGVGNVWSVEMLRRWLQKIGQNDIATLKSYMEILPEHLVRRFIAQEQNTIVVTGRVPDIDASELLPVIQKMEQAIAPIQARSPEFTISVTGLASVAARNSNAMITQLNYGLLSTVCVVVFMMGFAFRSVFAGIVSFLPNLFPVVAAGAVLYATGNGLQFASVVALTVAFGLAVDDTVHYLHRLHLEDDRHGKTMESLLRTMDVIGPVLILTTFVLILGLAVTIFSGLPSLRLFGWLSAATLIAALIGVLVFLPALVASIRKITLPKKVETQEAIEQT
ncbi:MAG: MMPL family transporter [Pseudomonadota bacterium]